VDLVVYDDEDQRYVPMLVALVVALLAAALIGGLAFFVGRSQPATAADGIAGVTEPQAGVTEPSEAAAGGPTCEAAIERADEALELGDRIERTLSEQTSLMDELLARRATANEVLDRALPPLTASAKDRQAFLEAMTAYQQARAECPQPEG
jgi:hypothetical protein